MQRPRPAAARVVVAVIAVLTIVTMHGSVASAHSCGGDPETQEHDADHGAHHGSGESRGSQAPHCGAMACTAIVTSSAPPLPDRLNQVAMLHSGPCEPLPGTPVPPDPPVPRLLPRI